MGYFRCLKLMCPNLISILFDDIIILYRSGELIHKNEFLDTLTRFDVIKLLYLLWRKMYTE